jgi:hypothetical protein
VATLLAIASIAGAQASTERPDVQIDKASRTEAITNLAREVESNFPIAELGTTTAIELRKRLGENRYSQTSAKALASTLTTDLRALTGDQHFFVDYFVIPRVFPAATGVADPVSEADRSLALRLHNFGFARVERLEGNVGYIKLDAFETPTVAGQTAAAAMQFLAGTDALIIDLRENGGGYSSMVSLLASYFFAEPVHLTDVSGRDTKQFRQNWTYAFVPGARYLDKPLYILSGARTFSAAEAFAYDLQALKRATIIGEKTRGGVSPSARLLLSSRFGVVMPTSRVTNPATGTNWEGGLKPDVTTSGAEALSIAHLAALESISGGHKDDPLTTEIENGIARLRREASTAARH